MNNLCKLAMSAACLLALPAGASALDLRTVGADADMEMSIDIDSIKVMEGSHTEVIVFTTYNKPQAAPDVPQFNATIARVRLRCSTVSGSIALLAFLQGEKVVKKFEYDVAWRPVDATSDIGLVWKYVCTRQWEEPSR